MSKAGEPVARSISARRHQGLRKLSPDLIGKARDETATQVTRLGLTFLGTAAFCLLSLLSPDSALLGGSEKINVPFGIGPVSFVGFMLLGPAVLIVLRIYLQIYVEHSAKLDRLARSVLAVRAPTLVPLDNPLMRLLSGLIFYLLLPVTMLLFAWKAAVFPAWGLGLLGVAIAVIVSHVALLFGTFSRSEVSRLFGVTVAGIVSRVGTSSWKSKLSLSVNAAIIAIAIATLSFGFGGLRRPFELYHVNLSGQWLLNQDFHEANLQNANLSSTNLTGADLTGANLSYANLTGANLFNAYLSGARMYGARLGGADLRLVSLTDTNLTSANLARARLNGADLSRAYLKNADLSDADLFGADLSGVNLSGANLRGADLRDVGSGANLSGANLSGANLSGADLRDVDLHRANLSGANLSGANLSGTNLSGAHLDGTNLSGAKGLTQTLLEGACRDAKTKLPEGLTLKSC
jgi:uncharacterized protein YjbI with pentapeptide repeats